MIYLYSYMYLYKYIYYYIKVASSRIGSDRVGNKIGSASGRIKFGPYFSWFGCESVCELH